MSRFAKAETRVQYVTNGGTPAEQERSEKSTEAANALLEQTLSERRLRRAALHACVFDIGAVKKVDGPDGPTTEHIPSWEMMFDPADAHRGSPTILVQRAAVDRDALIADFAEDEEGDDEKERERKEALREAILTSGSGGMVTADHTLTEQHCLVYELWRLPIGRKPGRHVIVTDNALVLDEVWTEKKFPFSFFGWSAPLTGAYPESIAAIVSETQMELDGVVKRISQILRQMAVPIYNETGPGDEVASQIRGGSDAIGDVIKTPPGTTLTRMSAGNVVGSELFSQEDRVWQRGFQETGISEQASQGTRPAGLNSAPAQREWNEINQDRLSLVALEYQQAHVDLAELLLDSIAKLPDYEINVKDPNGRWMRRMKAADLNLDKSDYVIQRFPIGALPTTPTGRLAAAADLLQMKAINPDQFQEISQLPDLKAELNVNLASRRATQKIVAKMLEKGEYIAPSDKMNLLYAAEYGTAKLMDAIADDLPEDRLQLLDNWLDDIAARLAKKAPAAAAGAPMPPGPTSIDPLTPAPLAPPPETLPPPGAEMAAAA